MALETIAVVDKSHDHYQVVRYLEEHPELDEVDFHYRNVGWSLGNDCPLKCRQCYSRSAREKGANLSKPIIDSIISQLAKLGVETVNLGGNEPIYTNGLNPKDSLLPYILEQINAHGMKVGITTAGPTLVLLERLYPEHLKLINDVDISLDSPRKDEHELNRGQKGIWNLAAKAMEVCERNGIPRTIIMCAMNWNFTEDRILEMIELAKSKNANVRFNPMKPIEPAHMSLVLTPEQFYAGLATVLRHCDPIDLSDPAWATSVGVSEDEVSGCPCGTSSFRIHSITPAGTISISPCVYLHDYKAGNLVEQPIEEIINSVPFREFRRRKNNPQAVEGCSGCDQITTCGGGCASRSYLHSMHERGDANRSLFAQDPYCLKNVDVSRLDLPKEQAIADSEGPLVHQGYLCTGIFTPKK